MSEKFRNKYRIESTRMQSWDYGSNAAYFVTICTKNRKHYFGDVIETQNLVSPQQPNLVSYPQQPNIANRFQMQLSEIGKIANQNWLAIPDHFPFVKLGNHVIMPNHMHGIIIIDKPMDPVQTQNFASLLHQTENNAPVEKTQSIASLPSSTNKFGPQSKNLASIIRGYKSSVKTYATMNTIDFTWQPLFHDHIIKNDNAFHRISEYIFNNPMNWKKDTFHK